MMRAHNLYIKNNKVVSKQQWNVNNNVNVTYNSNANYNSNITCYISIYNCNKANNYINDKSYCCNHFNCSHAND